MDDIWRRRVVAANGRIILVSSEGYKRKAPLLRLTAYLTPMEIVCV
jgi:hypothetical protein